MLNSLITGAAFGGLWTDLTTADKTLTYPFLIGASESYYPSVKALTASTHSPGSKEGAG